MNDQADSSAGRTAAGAPLTEAAWAERLRAIPGNEWAKDFDFEFDTSEEAGFKKARQAACIARWQAGRDVWNAWAEAMLALQREAEAAGLWKAEKDELGSLQGQNALTRAHLAIGAADFSHVDFAPLCPPDRHRLQHANFAALAFPYETDFRATAFGKSAKNATQANFHSTQFGGRASFEDAVFGSDTTFAGAVFSSDAAFAKAQFGGEAVFRGTQFGGAAGFESAHFGGIARFGGTQFGNHATFSDAQFGSGVGFQGADFRGPAWFVGALFGGGTGFEGVKFHQDADFGGGKELRKTRFAERTIFTCIENSKIYEYLENLPEPLRIQRNAELAASPWVTFEKGADFSDVIFEGNVRFNEARFEGLATFRAITPKKTLSFADARFRRPPDFIGVKFAEPPRLDNLVIEDPLDWQKPRWFSRLIGTLPADARPRITPIENDPRLRRGYTRSWPYTRMRIARDGDEHARFRKLREMAAAAKDHEQEVQNNAHEIAARRFWAASPFVKGERSAFWLGWLYQIVSDYGRSLWRPVAAWLSMIALFAAVFFTIALGHPDPGRRPDQSSSECHSTYEAALGSARSLQPTNKVFEAIALSFRDALIFDRSDVTRRMYGCLFGIQVKNNTFDYAITPRWVTALSSLQSLLSGILLFLFGLAVRNQFRMR